MDDWMAHRELELLACMWVQPEYIHVLDSLAYPHLIV